MSNFCTQYMLEDLITSKTRIKLLTKFFINSQTTAYLRNLELEFSESTNAIRQELNRFEKAGLLSSKIDGNKKVFQANTHHPLFSDIHNILMKHVGIDHIVEEVVKCLGNLMRAYIVGDFAKGRTGQIIDLILVGTDINLTFLNELIKKAENKISLKIRFITITPEEEIKYIKLEENVLLIWSSNK